jgi:nicotinic acid phosphoribosyltransferase
MAVSADPERLAPETFRLPVEKIRSSYYSDVYFALTKELLEGVGRRPQVTMQVFAKKRGLLGGIDEAVAILQLCSGREALGAAKIERFEEVGAPVDSYGVGSALLRGSFDFTADLVELGGRPCAKTGRELRPNPRLRPVA